jgi:hypothetical protein
MDSALSMFSTDYLVICGQAPACSMDYATRTLARPLDSNHTSLNPSVLCCRPVI